MADFLRERVDIDQVSVEYHNLAEGGERHVHVPGTLVTHLSGGGSLPVIAVDGELVATGTLPNLMDALDLANGKPVPAASNLAAQQDADGCGPDCC